MLQMQIGTGTPRCSLMLMQNNAHPRVAKLVNRFLGDGVIQTLNWPVRNPDSNRIEHLKDIFAQKIKARRNHPETTQSTSRCA